MIIDLTNGSMYLDGFLYQDQDTLSPSETIDDFIIKNESDAVVAYINESGYMFIKGRLV